MSKNKLATPVFFALAGLLAACGETLAQEGGKPPVPLPPGEQPSAPAQPADGPQGQRPIDQDALRALAAEIARLRTELADMKAAQQLPAGPAQPQRMQPEKPFAAPGEQVREVPAPAPSVQDIIYQSSQQPQEPTVVERERVVEREVPVYIENETVVEREVPVYETVYVESEPTVQYVYEEVSYGGSACHQYVAYDHIHSIGCGHHYYGCACHPWYYSLSDWHVGLHFSYYDSYDNHCYRDRYGRYGGGHHDGHHSGHHDDHHDGDHHDGDHHDDRRGSRDGRDGRSGVALGERDRRPSEPARPLGGDTRRPGRNDGDGRRPTAGGERPRAEDGQRFRPGQNQQGAGVPREPTLGESGDRVTVRRPQEPNRVRDGADRRDRIGADRPAANRVPERPRTPTLGEEQPGGFRPEVRRLPPNDTPRAERRDPQERRDPPPAARREREDDSARRRPEPERRPEPRAEPRPEPRPEPRAEPRREPRPEPRAEPHREPRPEPRPEPRAERRPERRPDPLPQPEPPKHERKRK